MKSLKDFILEAKSRQEIRIEVKDLEGADDFLSSLKKVLDEKNIYNEKIDKGLKFAIDGDDKEKYQGVLDVLKGYEKGADVLGSQIEKLESWMNEKDEESKEDDTKEKDKKEEE